MMEEAVRRLPFPEASFASMRSRTAHDDDVVMRGFFFFHANDYEASGIDIEYTVWVDRMAVSLVISSFLVVFFFPFFLHMYA